MSKTLERKLFEKIRINGGCWEWTGGRDRDDYGQLGLPKPENPSGRGSFRAHRLIYEMMVGSIPEGLTIDHTCRNKWCVLPEHLEPVTSAVNTRRALSDTCKRGHELEHGKSQRFCRTCRNNWQRRRYHERKAKK